MGEVHHLPIFLDQNRKCACGEKIRVCKTWSTLCRELGVCKPEKFPTMMLNAEPQSRISRWSENLLLASGIPFPPYLARHLLPASQWRAIMTSITVYNAVRRVTGRRVLVDGSKDARRLAMLARAIPESLYVLHLVRDGRAVAASAMRRELQSMAEAAEAWKTSNRRLDIAMRSIPKSRIKFLRYEDLCVDPQATMESLEHFLRVKRVPLETLTEDPTRHNVSGNAMRFSFDGTVEQDNRWLQELGAVDLNTFDRKAGAMNQRFGYG